MSSAALVGTDGSVDWLCLPRFDSPSVFAAILDQDIGGRFRIRPGGVYAAAQSYVQDTNILETTFATQTGVVSVTDFMPIQDTRQGRQAGQEPGQPAGAASHRQVLLRQRGHALRLRAAPRPTLAPSRRSARRTATAAGPRSRLRVAARP